MRIGQELIVDPDGSVKLYRAHNNEGRNIDDPTASNYSPVYDKDYDSQRRDTYIAVFGGLNFLTRFQDNDIKYLGFPGTATDIKSDPGFVAGGKVGGYLQGGPLGAGRFRNKKRSLNLETAEKLGRVVGGFTLCEKGVAMRFLAGVILGIVLSTSAVGLAGSGKGDSTGFNRSQQERRYDYFRERQQQQDIQNIRLQQQKEVADKTYRNKPC